MKLFAGIDPGVHGAVAAIVETDNGPVYIMSIVDRDQHPLTHIANWLRALANSYDVTAVLERVHSMPGQGVASTFKFGQSYGEWLGIVAAAGLEPILVRPQDWRAGVGLVRGGDKRSRKKASRDLAQELFPGDSRFDRVKDSDRAEAVLIAEYQRRRIAPGT